jgi:pimeloyl-ACP methyl ester carboxylesterase
MPGGGTLAWQRHAGTEGATLVLLHGLASNRSRWSEYVETSRLNGRHTLLCPDLRGHGASRADRRHGLSLGQWCDDLLRVLDAEGAEHAVLAGHSLGAQVALHFAHRHPRRVQALVLIDPVLRSALLGSLRHVSRAAPLLKAAAWAVRLLNRAGVGRRGVKPLDLHALDLEARAALGSPRAHADFVRRYSSTRADLAHQHTADYLDALAAVVHESPPLAQINPPTRVLLSTGATFADSARTLGLLQALPCCDIQPVDCHHWPLTERPAEVRDAIDDWATRFGGLHSSCAQAHR